MVGSDLDMNFLDGRIRDHRIHNPGSNAQSSVYINAPDPDCIRIALGEGRKPDPVFLPVGYFYGSNPTSNQNPVLYRVESGHFSKDRIISSWIRKTQAIR